MDSESLMCLDWILASTEYIEFVQMMLEFKVRMPTCPKLYCWSFHRFIG
jgi:hypothetical protein